MPYFKAKMHQIQFRLGLRPRPHWGSSQRFPRLPSWIKRVLLLKGGRGRKGSGRRKGKGGEGSDGTSPAWSYPDLGSTGDGSSGLIVRTLIPLQELWHTCSSVLLLNCRSTCRLNRLQYDYNCLLYQQVQLYNRLHGGPN